MRYILDILLRVGIGSNCTVLARLLGHYMVLSDWITTAAKLRDLAKVSVAIVITIAYKAIYLVKIKREISMQFHAAIQHLILVIAVY